MIKIYVADEKGRKYAETVMEREIWDNVNLACAEYEIIIDEDKYPSIEGIDEIVGCTLMNEVFDRNEF